MEVKEIKKECKYCGKQFIITEPRKCQTLYCSMACKSRNERETKRYKYSCLNCGKDVYRNNMAKDNIFCSNKCSNEYHSKLKREIRKCELCGNEFECILSDPKRFCSKTCQIEWQRQFPRTGDRHPLYKKDISIEQRTLTCKWCGKKYLVRPYEITVSKYCSKECKHAGMIDVARHQKSWEERVNSIPQQITNSYLRELNINFENEHYCGQYFTVDNYCIQSKLMIEVMGTYWHADIRKNKKLNDVQKRDIIQDKRKKTFIFNKFNINILYLWEQEIKEQPNLCKQLIQLYINNNGKLDDYNSFNYHLENGHIQLNNKIIKGYMDMDNDYKKLSL